MKHCHFSILYNEIAFLKQKLPFLYENFDQLIFFDLNIKNCTFSNDGSHEYIKNFKDPDKKITLIEKKDLSDVKEYKGHSFIQKRKMFAVGSSLVKDDMDYFWCTDMDEFFNLSLIKKVEEEIDHDESALIPHLIFFKNEKWVLSNEGKDGEKIMLQWPRIARHKKGTIYGHCGLQDRFRPKSIKNEVLFHFSHVGPEKVRHKSNLYNNNGWYNNVWQKFDVNAKLKLGELFGFPKMHPAFKVGVKLNEIQLPNYINVEQMMKDLKVR